MVSFQTRRTGMPSLMLVARINTVDLQGYPTIIRYAHARRACGA